MSLVKLPPTFLIEGGGQLICSKSEDTVANIVKQRIDNWGKHKAVSKSILLPTLRGYTQLKQLRKNKLADHCSKLAINTSITIICTTGTLDMLTIKIRRIRCE